MPPKFFAPEILSLYSKAGRANLFGLQSTIPGALAGYSIGAKADKNNNTNNKKFIYAGLGAAASGAAGRYAYKNFIDPAIYRALETAMHTTDVANAYPIIKEYWKTAPASHKKDVLKYIFTGKNPSGLANTFAYGIDGYNRSHSFYYRGVGFAGRHDPFVTNLILPPSYKNLDLIRSGLYGEPFGYTGPNLKIREVPFEQRLGMHEDWYRKNYPKFVVDRIKGYTFEDKTLPTNKDVNSQEVSALGPVIDNTGRINFGPLPINAGGHWIRYGESANGFYKKAEDAFKFKRKDYEKRYYGNTLFKIPFTPITKRLSSIVLSMTDHRFTPINIMTPWQKVDCFGTFPEPLRNEIISNPEKYWEKLNHWDQEFLKKNFTVPEHLEVKPLEY